MRLDPQLLFQRLEVTAKAIDDVESIFKCALCSYPPALFDNRLLLREPQKPVLANAIWDLMNTSSLPEIQGRVQYVLDGGALIHRIPWIRGSTYKNMELQLSYLIGYEGISTKDMTHQRRAKGRIGPTVTFTKDMAVTVQKEQFLANSSNKQSCVNMLSSNLVKYNCKTIMLQEMLTLLFRR